MLLYGRQLRKQHSEDVNMNAILKTFDRREWKRGVTEKKKTESRCVIRVKRCKAGQRTLHVCWQISLEFL